jgi:hypothetical protein
MFVLTKGIATIPNTITKSIKKNESRIEMAGGRCAMLGMYHLVFPSQYPIIPVIQIVSIVIISLKYPSRSSAFSIMNSFEPPKKDSFSYKLRISTENELINGRIAMLGMAMLFMLS